MRHGIGKWAIPPATRLGRQPGTRKGERALAEDALNGSIIRNRRATVLVARYVR
jgi:hypothetical protein